jgi:quercetin dioxygenase-like cupin family protein
MNIFTEKPWGHEILWASCERYAGKILFIKKGHRLSRQYHEKKEETIRVLEGTLKLELGEKGENVQILRRGLSYHVVPGTVHRFCAEDDDVTLVEVSTTELDDVVRLEDDWGRSS